MMPYVVQGLEVEPDRARFGDKILLKGDGYREKERIKIISDDKVFMATATMGGSFTFSFNPQFGGKKVITAKGIEKEETTVFWIRPKIRVYPVSGSRGTVLAIEGAGFSPEERVQMSLDRNYRVKFVDASKEGTLSANYIIDNQPAGKGFFYAVGTRYYLDDRKDFWMSQNLTLIPSKGEVGSLMTISGTGFAPGEPIVVDFGAQQTAAKVSTDYFGSFQIPFSVPKEKGGIVGVKAKGESSGIVSGASFTTAAKIKELPSSGSAGKQIRIEGDGFLANEKIEIAWNEMRGTPTKRLFCADEMGAFDIDYTIDFQPKGIKVLTITASQSNVQEKRSFEIKPCIEARYDEGTLTIEGTGFEPEEGVFLTFGETNHIGDVLADKNGSFFFSAAPKIFGRKVVAIGKKSRYSTGYIDVR
ncbi:hypothetical protein KKG61_09105 [bacterium]|nr:hypothetical protein [bacterium]